MGANKYYQVSPMILKGTWGGICYAIETQELEEPEHNEFVEACIDIITNVFDTHNHYSVSLREVKKELIYKNEKMENFKHYITIVQFRVRDSY